MKTGPALVNSFLLFNQAPFNTLSTCRCTYGEDCWPDASQFAQLASQVSQPLIHPVPPASACYPLSSPLGDCSLVQRSQSNGTWRTDQPGSMQFSNNERYTFPNGTISACYMDTALGQPCEQGNVPVIGVDARIVADVQVAVGFAAKHNLRLVVKNTGHDYLGRSTARGAFMIWTHHLKNITYDTEFVPQGAPASEKYNAITVSAGDQWRGAYEAVQAHGRFMVGGAAAGGSVGTSGGWFSGGGYSLLSPQYGLGIDNAVQATVVVSTGEHLTVNAHSHPDLFWALRGGGAATYGIVTSVTYRTYPSVPLTAAGFVANMTNPDVAKKLVDEHVRRFPELSDAGWSGHGLIAGTDLFQFFYLNLNTSPAWVNGSLDPFFSFAQNLTGEGLVIKKAYTRQYASYYDWYSEIYGVDGGGGHSVEVGSRLLPRDVVKDYEAVGQAFLHGQVNWILAGGAISQVHEDATGVNPAWRTALVHAVVGGGWQEGMSTDTITSITTDLKRRLAGLTSLAPNLGSYVNEASFYESNPRQTFFGAHYEKLRNIKAVYDPLDLFVVTEGVGSDEWDKELKCRVVSD